MQLTTAVKIAHLSDESLWSLGYKYVGFLNTSQLIQHEFTGKALYLEISFILDRHCANSITFCAVDIKDCFIGREVSYTVVFLPVLASSKFSTDHLIQLYNTGCSLRIYL